MFEEVAAEGMGTMMGETRESMSPGGELNFEIWVEEGEQVLGTRGVVGSEE